MATYSKKMMGKELGDAATYANPQTMTGKEVKTSTNPGKEPNRSSSNTVNMSVGAISNRPDGNETKTSGRNCHDKLSLHTRLVHQSVCRLPGQFDAPETRLRIYTI